MLQTLLASCQSDEIIICFIDLRDAPQALIDRRHYYSDECTGRERARETKGEECCVNSKDPQIFVRLS